MMAGGRKMHINEEVGTFLEEKGGKVVGHIFYMLYLKRIYIFLFYFYGICAILIFFPYEIEGISISIMSGISISIISKSI